MIVGLGNSIHRYLGTRHNVGFWFIDALLDFYKGVLRYKKKFLGFVTSVVIEDNTVYVLKPNLFMNTNGHAVANLSSFYNIQLSEILVVRDELDLLPGELQIKFGIRHNGHNGVKSIIKYFNKKSAFMQLCIGIGRPQSIGSIAKFVLEAPSSEEKKMIKKSIVRFIALNKGELYKQITKKKFFK